METASQFLDFLLSSKAQASLAFVSNKKSRLRKAVEIYLSGWQDSNLRPPGPKPGAMTGLRYAPISHLLAAESKGFEPLEPFPVRLFSKQVLSASQATLLAVSVIYSIPLLRVQI